MVPFAWKQCKKKSLRGISLHTNPKRKRGWQSSSLTLRVSMVNREPPITESPIQWPPRPLAAASFAGPSRYNQTVAHRFTVATAENIMPEALRPVSLEQGRRRPPGHQWNDGHRGVYHWQHLRRHCPCAGCREEREKPPDPFRILKPSRAGAAQSRRHHARRPLRLQDHLERRPRHRHLHAGKLAGPVRVPCNASGNPG